MSAYNYSQWNSSNQAAVTPAVQSNSTYSVYQNYQGYGTAAPAASTTPSYNSYQAATTAAVTYPYQPPVTSHSQTSRSLEPNQVYYPSMAAGSYPPAPVAPVIPAAPPAAPAPLTPVQPLASYNTQYPPSAVGQHQFSNTPSAPIATKAEMANPRGPFEAVHDLSGAVQPLISNMGRGGLGSRPSASRGSRRRNMGPPGNMGSRDLASRDIGRRNIGPLGMGPKDAKPRGTRPRDMGTGGMASRGSRSRGQGPRGSAGPRQSFGGENGFQQRGPRPLLGDNQPPDNWNGPHRAWDVPQENWNEPPDRWEGRQGPPDRFESKRGRDSQRGGKQGGERQKQRGKERFDRKGGKPPPLMGIAFNGEKAGWKDRNRKRQRNDSSSERHSKRRVDEDLTVTISARTTEDKDGYYCTLCKVTIKKSYEFQQHLRGRRHKQRAADQKEGGKPGTDASGGCEAMPTDQNVTLDATLTLMPIDDPDAIRFYCVICRLVLLEDMNKKAHDCTPSHLKRVKEIEDLTKSKQEDEDVCNNCVVAYKKVDEEEHKNSEAHKESLHWRMASCEVCTCKFNDTVELEKHFNLPRHYKQSQKLIANGLEPEQMIKYYENVQAAISEKRMSFCLICTTACGSSDNLEIHNILSAKFHDRRTKEAAKAGPDQFYCFCCNKVIDEADRRAHGKSMKHKTAKEERRSWNCEDCDLSFDQERKLYPHLQCRAHQKQVEKRKAIQRHAVNKFLLEWKAKQAEANVLILAQLSKLPRKALPSTAASMTIEEIDEAADTDGDAARDKADGEGEVSNNEQDGPGKDNLFETDMDVIPIAGHFCTVCNVFYQFDAGRKKICTHVKKVKGIREKPPRSTLACIESGTASVQQASGAKGASAAATPTGIVNETDGGEAMEAEEKPEISDTAGVGDESAFDKEERVGDESAFDKEERVGDESAFDKEEVGEEAVGDDPGVNKECEGIVEHGDSEVCAPDEGKVRLSEKAEAASAIEEIGEVGDNKGAGEN